MILAAIGAAAAPSHGHWHGSISRLRRRIAADDHDILPHWPGNCDYRDGHKLRRPLTWSPPVSRTESPGVTSAVPCSDLKPQAEH